MGQAKHTPGPWIVRQNPNGTLGIDARESDGTPCHPALVNGDATDEFYGPVNRANARLIAAAPDLLVACKWILGVVRHKSFCPAAEGRGPCNCGLHRVEAAVRAAEGE